MAVVYGQEEIIFQLRGLLPNRQDLSCLADEAYRTSRPRHELPVAGAGAHKVGIHRDTHFGQQARLFHITAPLPPVRAYGAAAMSELGSEQRFLTGPVLADELYRGHKPGPGVQPETMSPRPPGRFFLWCDLGVLLQVEGDMPPVTLNCLDLSVKVSRVGRLAVTCQEQDCARQPR